MEAGSKQLFLSSESAYEGIQPLHGSKGMLRSAIKMYQMLSKGMGRETRNEMVPYTSDGSEIGCVLWQWRQYGLAVLHKDIMFCVQLILDNQHIAFDTDQLHCTERDNLRVVTKTANKNKVYTRVTDSRDCRNFLGKAELHNGSFRATEYRCACDGQGRLGKTCLLTKIKSKASMVQILR